MSIKDLWTFYQTKARKHSEKEGKKQNWVNDVKDPSSTSPSVVAEAEVMKRATPKPVDEDLYKISPELLYAKTRKVCYIFSPFAH